MTDVTIRRSKMLTPHFSEDEMRCRCRRPDCNALPMKSTFMEKLERLRIEWGEPLNPTSGRRCPIWNGMKGGAPDSQHLWGNACDFWFEDPRDVKLLMAVAEKVGFQGIGVGRNLIHVDDRGYEARWTYAP